MPEPAKPLAAISLDLDNRWSYMKTHGDAGWETFPSYLDIAVPRILAILDDIGLKITFFIVGQDAALEKNRAALGAIAAAGHEIGNHSFHHEQWMHRYSPAETEREIAVAEEAIEGATGCRPVGFRGPGYSLSTSTLSTLSRRGYRYDASTFPTFFGPLARAYYFLGTALSPEERGKRAELFGGFADGFRPLRPYYWRLGKRTILEIPVTTIPGLRMPFHLSYIVYLSVFSPPAALFYLRTALALCRLTSTSPSFLLHPLDFMGNDDGIGISFFPGMGIPHERKCALASRAIRLVCDSYKAVGLLRFTESIASAGAVPVREPDFRDADSFRTTRGI
jgi:hypothetical protein